MKILCKTLVVGMLIVCGCLMCVSTASAKVCFVGDDGCAGGADFGDYIDPAADGKLCTNEGYVLKTECDADLSKHVTGYCPYNNDYVMCCGKEYAYDACVYPHLIAGKCGKKFKCICDSAKYPYTEDKCHSDYKFSNPGGTACTQLDAGPTDTVKTLYYSACLCERGLYPYSKQDCQETANADVNGDPCKDSQGNSYWDSCKCSNPPYMWESVDCEFGGKGKACVQGGVYFFTECCSCASFPAEGERGGRPNDVHATKWNTCDCPRKGRFQITQCSEGWQPNSDGSACERISCESAVKLFFSKNKDRYPDYAVFTGDKLVNYAMLTEAEKAKLPLEKQTYAVGSAIENNKAVFGVLAGNVSVSSKSCSSSYKPVTTRKCTKAVCTSCSRSKGDRVYPLVCSAQDKGCEKTSGFLSNKRYCTNWDYTYSNVTEYQDIGGYEMGCTKAATLYSGAYFGTLGSTADHLMVREACGADDAEKTVVPVLSFSGTAFPNANSRTTGISLYGAELKFAGTTNVNRTLSLVNTNVSGWGAVFNNEVELTRTTASPNGEKTTFAMSSSTFKNKLTANGYNFDVSTLNFEVPSAYKNKEFANLKFQGGETVKGGSIYLYPSYQDLGGDWGTSISFNGPASGSAVNVYSNIYIGYQGYGDYASGTGKGARVMYAYISGNLIWNMYEGNTNYKVGVTPNSHLISSDYGSGNYAKIKYNSSSNWRYCSGETRMLYGDRKKNAKLCTGDCHTYMEYKNYNESAYYFMTTINKDQKRTLEYYTYYIKTGTNSRCKCYEPGTDVNWDEGYFYIDGNHEWRQYLVNCGG